MNTCYYNHTNEVVTNDSVTPIMYPTRVMRTSDRARRAARQRLSKLVKAVAFLVSLFTTLTIRRAVRIFTVAACLFAFIGVIGGVEAGALSIGTGILICAFLLFLEILCLRPSAS